MAIQSADHHKLVNKILETFGADKRLRIWKQNTGGGILMSGQFVQFGIEGGADISGIGRDGKRLEIEIKTGKAKQNKTQVAFSKMIALYGGHYIVCRSLSDMSEWLDRTYPM